MNIVFIISTVFFCFGLILVVVPQKVLIKSRRLRHIECWLWERKFLHDLYFRFAGDKAYREAERDWLLYKSMD